MQVLPYDAKCYISSTIATLAGNTSPPRELVSEVLKQVGQAAELMSDQAMTDREWREDQVQSLTHSLGVMMEKSTYEAGCKDKLLRSLHGACLTIEVCGEHLVASRAVQRDGGNIFAPCDTSGLTPKRARRHIYSDAPDREPCTVRLIRQLRTDNEKTTITRSRECKQLLYYQSDSYPPHSSRSLALRAWEMRYAQGHVGR